MIVAVSTVFSGYSDCRRGPFIADIRNQSKKMLPLFGFESYADVFFIIGPDVQPVTFVILVENASEQS